MQPSVPQTLFCAECGHPTPADELARFGMLLVCPNCKERYGHLLSCSFLPRLTGLATLRHGREPLLMIAELELAAESQKNKP